MPTVDSLPNPLTVPMVDRHWMMDTVSDELDNYFRISREERIRVIDSIITEGWIETHPQIGGTIFEPWKQDSTPGFERMHATLQTVRRTARVRVIPHYDTYLVYVEVNKELEDLPQPIHSSLNTRPVRFDNSLDSERDVLAIPTNRGWIPQGRDFSLEQKILRNLLERVQQQCQSH